jgi:hypothetical protein
MELKPSAIIERSFETIRVPGSQELVRDLPGWTTRWGILAVTLFLATVTPVMLMVQVDIGKTAKGSMQLGKNTGLPLLVFRLGQEDFEKVKVSQRFEVSFKSFQGKKHIAEVCKIGGFSGTDGTFLVYCKIMPNVGNSSTLIPENGMICIIELENKKISILQAISQGL